MKKIITQLHRVTRRMTLSALVVSFSILPAYAYDGRYSAFDNQSGLRNSVTAGFRLRIPFGPTSRDEDKVRYGLQLNLRREYNNEAGWNNYGYMDTTQSFNAEIMSLDFSENGFKGLSFAGQQTLIYKNGVLMAVEGKDKKSGGGNGWLIAGGVVLLLVGGAALTVNNIKNTVNDIGKKQ